MANHAQRNLLHAYLDDELDLVRSMEIEDHLAECSDCAREIASYRAMRDSIKQADLGYSAPQEFRSRLIDQVREAERPPQVESISEIRSAPWWSWASVAASIIVLIAAFIFGGDLRREHNLAQEIVANHVRSLMAVHLTDVLTSDQHTVKPWFTGKLDFSPQVRDLSSDGFELVGGRLDYIEGRNAAAIVYQRRKHVINVFTWPSAGSDQEPRTTAKQGFNLVEWRQGGMYSCAISDLKQQELLELASMLRK